MQNYRKYLSPELAQTFEEIGTGIIGVSGIWNHIQHPALLQEITTIQLALIKLGTWLNADDEENVNDNSVPSN